ncbi:MAG: aldolase/citrate lyase family protein [Pirellulaceae bacterium]|nr:aldolase/citrate lyase family protein [Pirellulaceae bacterium]
MITENIIRFREKLASGQNAKGIGITLTDPAVTEALGGLADFFWIDLEHNPTNLETLMAHLIAARAAGTAAIVRIPSSDIAWVKRVLDSGAEGILLPQAKSVEEIAEFAKACRYPPMGNRGFGPRRPTNYGRSGGQSYLDHANENLFVAAQIETIDLVNQIDKVAQIKELTSLCLGPNDLSGTMGKLGQTSDPEVLDAIKKVATAARENGLFCGAGMGTDAEYANTLASLGVNWLQVGNDYDYMVKHVQQVLPTID